jgi:hypothetical protein
MFLPAIVLPAVAQVRSRATVRAAERICACQDSRHPHGQVAAEAGAAVPGGAEQKVPGLLRGRSQGIVHRSVGTKHDAVVVVFRVMVSGLTFDGFDQLVSLRRAYPEVYTSRTKLKIDVKRISVLHQDFDVALKKVVPSSKRSLSSHGLYSCVSQNNLRHGFGYVDQVPCHACADAAAAPHATACQDHS